MTTNQREVQSLEAFPTRQGTLGKERHMATYPLVFGFHDVVGGSGFWAEVRIDGRAIMVEEDDGTWFYGVEPGGLAGHGATAQEAHEDFRAGYRSVLADIVEEAEDFRAFRARVTDFLSTVNRPNEAEWEANLVRAGELKLDWLPVRRAGAPGRIEERIRVEELQDPQGVINDPDISSTTQSLAALAA